MGRGAVFEHGVMALYILSGDRVLLGSDMYKVYHMYQELKLLI